jgi:hypothetical protein
MFPQWIATLIYLAHYHLSHPILEHDKVNPLLTMPPLPQHLNFKNSINTWQVIGAGVVEYAQTRGPKDP